MIAHQPTLKTIILSDREKAFIQAYILHGNATLAVQEAGYKTKQPSRYASDLLSKEKIRLEIQRLLDEREQVKIAKSNEILQFYTSVMRGEVLDQFGIEASIDTRIKAANELAKHQIEIPLKLKQKEMSNNIGSVTLNFLPRKEED